MPLLYVKLYCFTQLDVLWFHLEKVHGNVSAFPAEHTQIPAVLLKAES